MNKERKINGISEFLQMSMTNNMPLSVNEKRQIFDLIIDLQNQLQQKENIIKEVREWANKTIFYFDFEEEITTHAFDLLYTKQGQELLEILDKGE